LSLIKVNIKVNKTEKQNCPLCETSSIYYATFKERHYLKCINCFSLFLSEDCRLNESDEKNRYLEHDNDINDEGYRKFVSPLTNHVLKKYKMDSLGLDYGAGTGPVISTVLNESGYSINGYDPYFSPDETVLNQKYDYITCCEVIEHFYYPKKEFIKLKNLLKDNGELICKTDLYDETIDFNNWYYKNDPTHVFFYSINTFKWIQKNIGFNKVSIEGRVVIFEK